VKILKFGGSSVGTPERIASIIALVTDSNRYAPGEVRGIVVSAFQGVTDTLITLAHQASKGDDAYKTTLHTLEKRHLEAIETLVPVARRSAILASAKVTLNELGDLLHGITLVSECSSRTLDLIMSFGERLSAYIVTEAFISKGYEAEMLDAREIVWTNEVFGNARPDKERTERATQVYFASHPKLQIITGFIGTSNTELTTTLGRGGSDYTASIIGAALNADEIEIWTDVDGMLTADPRKVPKAFPIPEITFEEAMELCHFGAKVIYPPTMQPAIDAHIPLVIKNTLKPDSMGTRIVENAATLPYPITGISSIGSIALIRLEGSGMVGVAGTAARLFKALAAARINIILITQASSEHTICCAIDPASIECARTATHEEFSLEIQAGLISPLVVEEDLAIVSIVGERMRQTPGISARIFSALGSNAINVVAVAQGSSELNVSAVISHDDESKALNALHDEFFSNRAKTINLWIIGTGLIGSTLLSQLEAQRDILRDSLALDLQLRGVANSRKMVLAKESDDALDFTIELSDSAPAFVVSDFIDHIRTAHLPNCVFVDCTASDDVPQHYPKLLRKNIAVVTPNKRGISSGIDLYNQIISAAHERRTPFLHETCVGAALPVLSTLRDLVRSGDQVHRIEAVLSGTLSFIFNSMAEGRSFSDAVKEAKQLGYTEPDPRDDLSGADVARKVLILARNAGLPFEVAQVTIHPMLPAEASSWSVDEFMERLPSLDSHFEAQVNQAREHGKRLFFGALIDCVERRAEIGLRAVPLSHPFCALSGSDNIVAFSTRRYTPNSLVVKGPGAGAEVTAAGVFADIIRIAH
jgi:aspartokinase/homoserine dehydrogenase 1